LKRQGLQWAVLKNRVNVLNLCSRSFLSHAEGQKEKWLPTANIIFNRKMKCVFFLLIFFNLFLAKEMVSWGLGRKEDVAILQWRGYNESKFPSLSASVTQPAGSCVWGGLY
jgi:hypothetical protein